MVAPKTQKWSFTLLIDGGSAFVSNEFNISRKIIHYYYLHSSSSHLMSAIMINVLQTLVHHLSVLST
jgi:hypothetical protein